MSEKSCETCRHISNSENICIKCDDIHRNWQPKEEKMRKPNFQISEEQARELLFATGVRDSIDIGIEELKQAGYIRRSPVDEAEEMYQDWQRLSHDGTNSHEFKTVVKLYEALQYLKKQLDKK